MNKAEVLRLATLARIEISDAEAESLSHEFEAILKYVASIKDATDPTLALPLIRGGLGGVYNVFRADENPHESGKFSEAILREAPSKQGDFIRVKKIL